MTNYLTQDAALSPPDTSRAEEEEARFDRSFSLWLQDDLPLSVYKYHKSNFVEKHYKLFTKYLQDIYRPLYDKLHKEIEDDRYPL